MSITSTSELELSLISCASSDSTLTWQGVDKRKGRRPEGWGWGRFCKGGDYFKYFCLKGLIILGRRLIYGWLLFEECGTPSLSSRIDRLYCIKHAVSQPAFPHYFVTTWNSFISFCQQFLRNVFTGSSGSGVKQKNVPGDSRSVLITDLKPDTRYRFTVFAHNEHGAGIISEEVIARTYPSSDVPGRPLNLVAEAVSESTVRVTWAAPTTG